MGAEQPGSELEWQERFEELSERVAANRADIDALQGHANDVNHRTAAGDLRAGASEARAEASQARADASEARADDDRRRISELEDRADIDRELIAELQADGVLNREHAEQMRNALHSSRMIGAAIGIIMASRNVTEEAAFELLRSASQQANRKVRILADEVVRTGDVSDLPGA